jgi:hypothetical protein
MTHKEASNIANIALKSKREDNLILQTKYNKENKDNLNNYDGLSKEQKIEKLIKDTRYTPYQTFVNMFIEKIEPNKTYSELVKKNSEAHQAFYPDQYKDGKEMSLQKEEKYTTKTRSEKSNKIDSLLNQVPKIRFATFAKEYSQIYGLKSGEQQKSGSEAHKLFYSKQTDDKENKHKNKENKEDKVKLTEEVILADRKKTEDEYNKLPKKLGEPKKPEGSGRRAIIYKSLKKLLKKYKL